MIKRVDLGLAPEKEVLGNPTPLGLLGLSIAAGALAPVAFGWSTSVEALKTVAVYAVLFGAGCQFLSGLMNFVNKNMFGGTIFTAFSFLWAYNAWSLYSIANGMVPDHAVGLAVEMVLLVIFLVLTYGFGFFSSVLFAFLVDIDLIFLARIIKSVTGTTAMNMPIAVLNVGMLVIALWLAFGSLINPVAGRPLFGIGKPVFFAAKKRFDWSIRYNLFEQLYLQWREQAFVEMPLAQLQAKMSTLVGERNIVPDLFYLQEFGYVVLTTDQANPHQIISVRLNGAGIDLYEQIGLKKYEWG